MTTMYAVQLADASWYDGHGGYDGCGCLRAEFSAFPPRFYKTEDDAREAIAGIVKDFPKYGKGLSVVRVKWDMKKVFTNEEGGLK